MDGHSALNDALQTSELTLDYLEGIGTSAGGPDPGSAENDPMTDGKNAVSTGTTEGPESPANESGEEAGQSPTPEAKPEEDGAQGHTAADLVPYWSGSDVGHLGRWLWERGGVPEGEVGAGLYADRELHMWIEEALEAGPNGTTEQTQIRLRWVLWRLYATHGSEEVPDWQIHIPPMRRV